MQITRMISDQTVLHPVQLPLLMIYVLLVFSIYLFIFSVSINEVVLSYYKERYWIILINVLIYDSNSSIFERKKNQLIEKFLSTAGLILLAIFLILCKLGFWGTTFKMFIY